MRKVAENTGDLRYAGVYLIDLPFHADKKFYYYLPDDVISYVRPGAFVVVPFGNANKKQTAVVSELCALPEGYKADNIKPVLSLLFKDFVLDSEFLSMADFMRERTFCTFGQAVRAMIPSAVFGKISEKYCLCGELPLEAQKDLRLSMIFSYLKKAKSATADRISLDLGIDAKKAIKRLVELEVIKSELEIKESRRMFAEKAVMKASSEEAERYKSTLKKSAVKLAAVLDEIAKVGRADITSLRAALGDCREQLKCLVRDGIIEIEKEEIYRDPYSSENDLTPPDGNILSHEQNTALEKLTELYLSPEPKAALLQGVTGSGKTRVIKALADRVIADKKGVILLIPEISLTPQTVRYFKSCYGNRVAVLHSSLSAGEKLDMWNRIRRGEIDICVGTRSAIFAPFSDVGLIVMDEEQEHTYKSDSDPKYHARDIARFRCAYNKCLMLLASATPSVESRQKAESGAYSLVTLNERYGSAVLPSVIIADMRKETLMGYTGLIGGVLEGEIRANLEKKEQTILFLNRRGYNNFLVCPKCGEVITCRHCSSAMTYHTSNLGAEKGNGYLACHLCGSRRTVPTVCEKCGFDHLSFMGAGTQKLEEELVKKFPEAVILRMDADTTASKFSYEEILGKFRRGEADILIGTQMVTKGHDFPNVTLSAVISADKMLYINDYHATERCFDMICQLVGRSGRGEKAGRALIQTYNPHHPIILLAAAQDYNGFYKKEIADRRALIFPPCCDMAVITVTSENEATVLKAMEEMSQSFRDFLFPDYMSLPFDTFGPFEAPIYKVMEQYRIKFVIKCRMNAETRKIIRQFTSDWSKKLYKSATVALDVNPSAL